MRKLEIGIMPIFENMKMVLQVQNEDNVNTTMVKRINLYRTYVYLYLYSSSTCYTELYSIVSVNLEASYIKDGDSKNHQCEKRLKANMSSGEFKSADEREMQNISS